MTSFQHRLSEKITLHHRWLGTDGKEGERLVIDVHVIEGKFDGADLRRADFTRASFHLCSFKGTDLRDTTFARAYVNQANFSFARFDGADFTGAHLYECDCTGADLSQSTNLNPSPFLLRSTIKDAKLPDWDHIPRIPNIHTKVRDAIFNDLTRFDMDAWHQDNNGCWHTAQYDGVKATSCCTTHCRAGWAIALANAWELEKEYSPGVAATMIYRLSDPHLKEAPDWHQSNEKALEDIQRLAEAELHR